MSRATTKKSTMQQPSTKQPTSVLFELEPVFEHNASKALANTQLRRNMGKATQTIRAKRATVVDELSDWEALREAGRAIKAHTLRNLDKYLLQLEASVEQAGGHIHWASDAAEANQIITEIVQSHQATEVIKIKSLTTDEIRLNKALATAGINATETDLAELIIQLAEEHSSHILVPAIHKNRAEIREIFMRTLGVEELSDDPQALAAVARTHLRRKFLSTSVAISGANFAVAETGTVCIVESEGNGRTNVLGDEIGRQTLNCIRCSACLNICPVYERTGGHAYGSVYPGPIGAILTPQLVGVKHAKSLPYASSLCGACYDVCPVKINIPEVLIHLRGETVRQQQDEGGLRTLLDPENIAFKTLASMFSSRSSYERAQRLGKLGQLPFQKDDHISWMPGMLSGWTAMRDMPTIPKQTFREWWEEREQA